MSQIDDFLSGKPAGGQTSSKSEIDAFLGSEDAGFAARVKQGFGRAVDSARTALTDDPNKIAQIAAEQSRNALPQSATQRQMAEEFAPYVDAANKVITFSIKSSDTATFAWKKGVYEAEVYSNADDKQRIAEGAVTVSSELLP